jgi:alpha-tubulin suppressor-like RCC1 family protein
VTSTVLLPVGSLLLTGGNEHTCALVTGGLAYCWGANSSSQVGAGTTSADPVLRPRAVSSSSNARIESFATLGVGGKSNTTCGLLSTGAGFCWGGNLWGNVGDGTTIARSFPMTVSGALSFSRISTGWTHSCGLTRTGVAYCWGYNTVGQLGDGTTTQRLVPTPVAGTLTFSRISAGYNSTCGVTTAGDLYCWGDDPLGDGTATSSALPVQIGAGRSYATVATGFRNACALTPTGQAWCWGLARTNGQLGNGTTSDQFQPTAVSGGLTFQTIVKGEDHTCGLTGTGTVYCWGSNAYGQLGDGTVVGRTVPTLVSGTASYTAIAAGAFHTCGSTTTGVVNCWGRNNSGQLGDGTSTSRLVPTPWQP